MHRVALYKIALFIACLAFTSVAEGKESGERTAFSFDAVQAEAMHLAELAGGPEKVLLVFDIDNTLLAMKQDISSDQWFNWQRNLPQDDPRSVGDFEELLRVQGLLYSICSMRTTEPVRQPEVVRQLQLAGFTTLLLTSRGYQVRDATRRELLANGYNFRKTTMAPQDGFAGPYFPYEVSRIRESGITPDEAEQWLADSRNPGQLKKPREVSYSEGVYMVAGQNKGAMLRMLLQKSGHVDHYQHIVFVDDNSKNTKDVRDAFANQPVNVVTIRYAREDANVRRFNEDKNCEKQCATLALRSLQHSLSGLNVSKSNPPLPLPSQRVPEQQVQQPVLSE